MIKSKQELNYYLECDRRSLCINRKSPRLWSDEVWKFQRSLRRLEYYSNVRGGNKLYNETCRKVSFS